MTAEQRRHEAEERDELRDTCDECGDGCYVPTLVDGRLVDVWHCHCTDREARQ